MSIRHWLLMAGSVCTLVAWIVDGDTGWTDLLAVFGGGLAGIWATEGVRARAREQGIDMEPL